MADDVIAFRVSPEQDPNGTAVDDILQAHAAYRRSRAARYFWVHVLAIIGVAGGLCMLVPGIATAALRHVVLALWGACCVAVMAMAAVEWKWVRRQTRLLAQNTIDAGHPNP